ncbi:SDR family oxidoreductase [Pseudonocardia sp. NPDC049154]|uniref:SDR family NAD(P)-dependent oxidoreductase n=1 Tax=Pseudonocardia sp. NPDC049154 TaxID=3155501 RepID=UPI0033D210E7
MDFDKRVVIVTGAASGIGEAASRLFASRNARLVLADRSAGPLAELAEELGGTTDAVAVPTDLAREDDIARLFAQAVAEFGTVDHLYNNAGILDETGPLLDTTADTVDRLLAVNTRAPFLCLREFARILVGQGKPGSTVATGSVAGTKGVKGETAYSMSKHAIIGMTRSAAAELGPHDIRVNIVLPGRIETPMITSLGDQAVHAQVTSTRPIGRVGRPEEIAALAAWLMGDEAGFVTGAVFTADGGFTC